MSSWAKPGVKCVCIKKGLWNPPADPQYHHDNRQPTAGEVLTIRNVTVEGDGIIGLWFVEKYRDGYLADHFRPLVTRTQSEDLSIFTPLLKQDEITRLDFLLEEMSE